MDPIGDDAPMSVASVAATCHGGRRWRFRGWGIAGDEAKVRALVKLGQRAACGVGVLLIPIFSSLLNLSTVEGGKPRADFPIAGWIG